MIPFLKILEDNHLFCLTTKKAFYERDNVSKFRINPHLHCFLSNLFTILSQVEVQSLVNGKTNVSKTFCMSLHSVSYGAERTYLLVIHPINLDDTKYWFKGCVDFAIQVGWSAY